MFKPIAQFEFLVENKVGRFLVEHDAPISVVKEMAFQFLKYLGQLEDQAKAQQQNPANPAQNPASPEENKPSEAA